MEKLGLLEKTCEIYSELVYRAVASYQKSSNHLLSKVYHLDQNPKIKVIYISVFWGINRVKRDLDEETIRFGNCILSKPFKVSIMSEMVHKYLDE